MKEKFIIILLRLVAWASDNLIIREDTLINFIKNCDFNNDGYISLSEFITKFKDFLKRRIVLW